MRPRTAGVIVAVFVLLGATAAVGLGVLGGATDGLDLEPRWVSETVRDVDANHHAVAVGTVGDRPMVFAPVSGQRNTTDCGLYAFTGNGSATWSHGVTAENCTIHAVADPTLADFDADGDPEVLAATTDRALYAFDARTGERELRAPLRAYGYTQPVVADLTGDGTPEVVVVDAFGTVSVRRPDGTVRWRTRLETFTWGQPAVADFDADGARELAVGVGGSGALHLFEADGTTAWKRTDGFPGGITWLTTGQTDADDPVELAVATADGDVLVVDGATGETQWRRDLGTFAAVHALGDGDDDGTPELYATAKDGTLRAIDAGTGGVEWSTPLTTASVQMTPPPSLGDVDGDGNTDLVAVSNDGRVAVLDPETGEVRAAYARDTPIFTHPTTADLDGDGRDEIYVSYGDGRVVVLDATD